MEERLGSPIYRNKRILDFKLIHTSETFYTTRTKGKPKERGWKKRARRGGSKEISIEKIEIRYYQNRRSLILDPALSYKLSFMIFRKRKLLYEY